MPTRTDKHVTKTMLSNWRQVNITGCKCYEHSKPKSNPFSGVIFCWPDYWTRICQKTEWSTHFR